MKRFIFLGAILLVALSGCMQVGPPPVDEGFTATASVGAVAIYRPLLSAGDVWRVNALNRTVLSWRKGTDQYGDPVGLWASGWKLFSVTVQCELKDEPDTLFYPIGLDDRDFVGDVSDGLSAVWYPTFTAPIDEILHMPYPPFPERGYPFSYCLDTQPEYMPPQTATITARARADVVTVHVIASGKAGGSYQFNGGLPQASNEADVKVNGPGSIEVVWTDDGESAVAIVEIPVDWFWLEGSWDIDVGPVGCTP